MMFASTTVASAIDSRTWLVEEQTLVSECLVRHANGL
jgi:hypothetical protein